MRLFLLHQSRQQSLLTCPKYLPRQRQLISKSRHLLRVWRPNNRLRQLPRTRLNPSLTLHLMLRMRHLFLNLFQVKVQSQMR